MLNVANCTKRYTDYPAAHRISTHQGHCSKIHGHNFAFEFTFRGPLDINGFVTDFGDLKWLREYLDSMFDHTCLIESRDPLLKVLTNMACFDVRVVENASSEGLAKMLFKYVAAEMAKRSETARLVGVTVFEDSRNSVYFGTDL